MRTFAAFLVLLLAHTLTAGDFPVPLLELKQVKGEWTWTNNNGPIADAHALVEKFSVHKGDGWQGLNKAGTSDNPLVIHVYALAPQAEIDAIVDTARHAGIRRVAIAAAEEVTTPAAAPVDLTKLDAAYVVFDTQANPGAMPSVPKEQLTVYCNYESSEDTGSYVVALDARGRKPGADSSAETHTLIYAQGEPADERKVKADLRAALQAKLVAAIEDYVANSGARIEQLEVPGADSYRPWVFTEMAARACEQVNSNREKAGKEKFELRLMRVILAPPEPERIPEVEVEYPKDEPGTEEPTEDPRIVEEATDEHNEDPSDSPNRDLAENPNDDPSDEDPVKAVGLGGDPKAKGFAYRRARGGAGRPYEDRTKAALDWLKDHQNREGYWSGTGFGDDTTRTGATKTYNIDFVKVGEAKGDAGWEASCDLGLTGLSLLAFVGAGYDHKEGDYKSTCRHAILYLRKVQDNDGCFGLKEDDHFIYNHAICTMAMAEVYGLSGDAVLKPIVEKAIDFIIKAQNPGLGWRYGVQPGVNDSSVTGWMVMALKSCKLAGLEFDSEKAYTDAQEWFEMVTVDVAGYPKCGYDSPGSNNARLRGAQDYENNPSMDAIYITSMLSMGKVDKSDRTIKSMATVCAEKAYLPQWSQYKIDFYYWYYASLALYQVGGASWATWEKALSQTLLDNQRGWTPSDKQNNLTKKETLDEHGSWDAVDAWSTGGGRVYATALGALMLETTYRYERPKDK